MLKKLRKYFDALKILSFNAVYYFIISNRNYGKTWCLKRRQFRRALKHGKKCLWVRRFTKEVKEATATMYASSDLQKFCGIVPYDPKTKTGNFKQVGRTCYVLRNGKWEWFLKIVKVTDANAMRSADDVKCDTIIYDEHTTTPDKMRYVRGNEVEQFIDMFISAKREHKLLCIFLGNKEATINPYLQYFGIEPLPSSFEGIRTYKKGSLVVQQINNISKAQNDYDLKVQYLLEGTPYGAYLQGAAKSELKLPLKRTPAEAQTYIQLNFNNNEMRFTIHNGFFYVSRRINKQKRVYTNIKLSKYKDEALLVKRQKRLFLALINAISDNRIYYDTQATYEAAQAFYAWLGI